MVRYEADNILQRWKKKGTKGEELKKEKRKKESRLHTLQRNIKEISIQVPIMRNNLSQG